MPKKIFYKKGFLNSHVNIGSGKEISIRALVKLLCKIVGYNGKINFLSHMPDGTPRKLLNIKKIKSMINYENTNFEEALKLTVQDYIKFK